MRPDRCGRFWVVLHKRQFLFWKFSDTIILRNNFFIFIGIAQIKCPFMMDILEIGVLRNCTFIYNSRWVWKQQNRAYLYLTLCVSIDRFAIIPFTPGHINVSSYNKYKFWCYNFHVWIAGLSNLYADVCLVKVTLGIANHLKCILDLLLSFKSLA